MSWLGLLLVFGIEASRLKRSGGEWGYSHDQGADWPSSENSCGGIRQSPIDIPAHTAEAPLVAMNVENYDKEVSWKAKNTKHSVQLDLASTEKLKVSGGALPGPYVLAQFHFHWGSEHHGGSEHWVAGKQHFAEIHLVHFKEEYGTIGDSLAHDDGLGVLGFFVDASDDAVEGPLDVLIQQKIGKNVEEPTAKGAETPIDFQMSSILPSTLDNYYRYLGSLTTPGCNEIVVWSVFKDALKITQKTKDMMVEFAEFDDDGSVLTENYRAAQDLHERTVTFYSSTVTEAKDMPEHESFAAHNWYVFVIGVVLVVAIAGLAIFFCKPKKEPEYAAGQN